MTSSSSSSLGARMQSSFRNILILSLLLLLVSLTVAAEDSIQNRGCRRGKMPLREIVNRQAQHMLWHRRASVGNPYIGDCRQLVVLAAFSDRPFADDSLITLHKWDQIFNQEAFNVPPYVGSVHDYFFDQSYGQLRLTFDLQYITLGNAKRYASTQSDDENSQFLVNDIVDSLLHRSINWDDYDWSDDGTVNQLLIIYAGQGMNDGGGSNTIWPHQWWLSKHLKQDKTEEFCEPRTFSFDEKDYTVDCYCAVQSEGGAYNPFGTLCHEYSHCFGLPDFYYGSSSFLYGWDIMDFGNYNGGGYCPAAYSAHERMYLGWLTPKPLTDATKVTDMSPLHLKDEAYIVYNDSYPDEFYLIENRQQQLWDTNLPSSGIVISHVNFDSDIWLYDMPNKPSEQHYLIVPANNKSYSDYSKYSWNDALWTYPYEDNDRLTNTSSPAALLWNANTDGTKLMNKSIIDMAVADGLASFNFDPTPTAIQTIRQYTYESDEVWYNLSGLRIAAPASSLSHSRKGFFIRNGKKYVLY